MIRPLRQRHRVIISILAVLLLILFVSALLMRQPMPAARRLPDFQKTARPGKGGAQ